MNSSKSNFCYREKRLKPFLKHVFPRFIQCQPLIECNAHISMYGVTKDVAEMIMKAGTVRNFKPIHYNPFLWVDVDAMGSSMKLKQALVKRGYSFLMFLSGNKGAHFAIKRVANPSSDLYLRDKMLVQREIRGLPGGEDVDISLYNKPLHLIRAIGCVHDKTGKRKSFYFKHHGEYIPDVTEYKISQFNRYVDYEPEIDEVASWRSLQNAILAHYGPTSSRYLALWQLSKDLFKNGFDQHLVDKIVRIYNDDFERPHERSEVERAIKDAHKAVFGPATVN